MEFLCAVYKTRAATYKIHHPIVLRKIFLLDGKYIELLLECLLFLKKRTSYGNIYGKNYL
jgi:hypothetical protein